MDRDDFVAYFGGVFEESPWIAREAWESRPFGSVDALHAAMVWVVEHSPRAARLELIRAHPDLAGKAAIAGALTPESTREQAAAGLDRLTPALRLPVRRLRARADGGLDHRHRRRAPGSPPRRRGADRLVRDRQDRP